jgi:hypothetical protein
MHLRISVLCLWLHWQCSCSSWTVFFKQFYALLRLCMRKKTVQCTPSSNVTQWSYALFMTTVLPTPQSQILYPNTLAFSVFTNLVFRLTRISHLFLLRAVLKKWTRFEFHLQYAGLTQRKKKLNSTDICWCSLTIQTARINVIRLLVLQKRGKFTERETVVHNLLYILSLCAALLAVTRYLLENKIGILCFFKWMKLYRQHTGTVYLILFTFHLLLFHNKFILSEVLLLKTIQLTFCSLEVTAEK